MRRRSRFGPPCRTSSFIRERYGIQPTPIAVELAPVIAQALAQLDEAYSVNRSFDPATAERLLTVAPNGYIELVLIPAVVARLRVVAPGITLRLIPINNDLAETGVVSGITALVLGRIVNPPDSLVVQHLFDECYSRVVRAGHPEIGSSITRSQFERLKQVNVVPPGRLLAGLFQALAQQNLKRDVAISATTSSPLPR